jgi:endonuclease/exonuclease/phosphatase family metal-dependent hydrolase
LQEALAGQLDEILQALPHYRAVGVGRDDGKRSGELTAILYLAERFDVPEQGTFWLSDTPDVPGSKSWGNVLPRICTWARLVDRRTGSGFYVYNLHLSHASQPSRERSAELLAERISKRASSDRVVVLGDLNAGESNPVMQYLTGKLPKITTGGAKGVASPQLVDTFRVLHSEAVEVGTYHGFNGATNEERIDHVLVQPAVRVLEAAIVRDNENGRYPSDHYPVFARLRLVPAKD